jgi:carbamoyltransferase
MLSMGLGGSNHDFAACLVQDGRIRVAIEEERLGDRRKYSVGVNSLFSKSWRYCLDACDSELAQVSTIVADDTLLPTAYFQFRSRVVRIRHHLAHAASAFYPSPFHQAAILVTDGAGSLIGDAGVETLTTAVGDGSSITEISKVLGTNWKTDGLSALRVYQAGDSDHSLGFMYKAVSRAAGFVLYEDDDWYLTEDGKTMGLAPYGTDRFHRTFREHLSLLPDGRFELHLKNGGLLDFVEHALDGVTGQDRFARAADLAWAAQAILEETLIHCARKLYENTGLKRLCMAGGVALNCVANGRVLAETPFEEIFIQPGAGDSGCAVGCAYYGHHVVAGEPRHPDGRDAQRHAYLGRSYGEDDVRAGLERTPLPAARLDQPAALAARLLSEGKILGWFTGGAEFGPRALGHRSILADPRRAEMKETLNDRVKHREWFRPFAPAVLAEHAAEYFELPVPSPYMLLVASVVRAKRAEIPAVVHVDGTARVQSVTRKDNGVFYDLVSRFYELTSVPVVLNTSLNGRGQPIVETPEEAIAFFAESRLDYMFLEDSIIAHDQEDLDWALALAGEDRWADAH